MNDVQYLIDRQLGIGGQYNYDNILRRLIVRSDECYYGLQSGYVDPGFEQDPPIFACKFAEASGYEHILALANEDGRVALQDTSKVGGGLEGFQCHNNAVFDLVWLPGELKFVTVSGDHTAALWDCGGGEPRRVSVLAEHSRSVRTAAVWRGGQGLLATGARDGLVLLWDPRSGRAVDRLAGCHDARAASPPARRRAPRPASVTALAFRAPHELLSAGESDGNVKLWDLRRSYRAATRAPLPARALPYAGASARCGYTHLLLDAAGARLYAGCMDGVIYCYNLAARGSLPERRYRGHESATFYIRAALSADDRYLVSGSSDRHAYVWRVGRGAPLLRLAGHRAEVTCAAWRADARAPPALLVTCGDDARHKLWRVGPEEPPPEHELRGRAEPAPPEPATSPPAPARTPQSAGRPRPAARSQRCLLQLLCAQPGPAPAAPPALAPAAAPLPSGMATPPSSKRRAPSEERPSPAKKLCAEESWGALPAGCSSPGRERTPERRSPLKPIQSPSATYRSPPTSRLPDFVRDGEAPHLRLMSPVRRRPDAEDWLTRLGRERRGPEAVARPQLPTTPPPRRPSNADRTPKSTDRPPKSADRPPRSARRGRTLLKYFTVTTKTEQ